MSVAPVAKILTLVVLLSAVLHLIWENAQAPLFVGYQSFWQHFWICLQAIPGDVVVTLLIYFLVAAWHRNVRWIERIGFPELAVVSIAGAATAVGLERYALGVGRWAYAPAMPLLPGLEVGLLPVLQMAVVPALTFLFTAKLQRPITT